MPETHALSVGIGAARSRHSMKPSFARSNVPRSVVPIEFAVVSTGLGISEELKRRHFESVSSQTIPAAHHIYYDARYDLKPALETLYHEIHKLPPSTVVLSVDADDWLSGPNVTKILRDYYQRGAWMTWGSYVNYDNGRRWHGNTAFDSRDRRSCRKQVWFASHLKTFRAGLFQQIKLEDLKSPLVSPDPTQQKANGWVTDCTDLAFMFPMLEMSAERGRFVKECLYVYNNRNPLSVHNSPFYRQQFQKQEGARLRAMKPYPRLKERPW